MNIFQSIWKEEGEQSILQGFAKKVGFEERKKLYKEMPFKARESGHVELNSHNYLQNCPHPPHCTF